MNRNGMHLTIPESTHHPKNKKPHEYGVFILI